jgi:DNA-directed RNA polymerase subunit beta'
MRTFHTGGIAEVDITSGLPRVEELLEARTPKGEAVLSEIDGLVEIPEAGEARVVSVVSVDQFTDEYPFPDGYKALAADGQEVVIGTPLAEPDEPVEDESTALQPAELVARVAGTVSHEDGRIVITWNDEDRREYSIPAASHVVVRDGDRVTAGQELTHGPKSPQQVLRIQGRDAVQEYLIQEVQKVYRSQGVTIHDKHIEVIVAQMLRKVRVDAAGDTELLPGELIDRYEFEEINAGILAEGGEPATASPVLLGITRASLNTDSFLAAASFQETTRVLTESAVNGAVDHLRGLKENVIIGRLIPARFDLTEEGRERLGLEEHEDEQQLVGVRTSPIERSSQYGSDEELEGGFLGELRRPPYDEMSEF